ncbi:TOMM precursor leader peptide-binding protein [Streptomyces sp. NPDC005574]|uniref:TOMM precursor leader peptide-binding protein n=1 Tax=Streptomyces sp. NPDC005574 TaxID=3156891 RepID=UPI0033AF62AF
MATDGTISGAIATDAVPADPATWPQAQCHVVASAREDVSFFQDVDTFTFEWSLTWAPLVLTSRGVRLGPVVTPGSSACYHCFLRRRLQHDWEAGDTRARCESVTRDPSNTAAAWLPSDLMMARGLTQALVAMGPDAFAGTVVTYDGVHGDMSRDPVIGVQACPRCQRRTDRDADSWAALAALFPPEPWMAGLTDSEPTR